MLGPDDEAIDDGFGPSPGDDGFIADDDLVSPSSPSLPSTTPFTQHMVPLLLGAPIQASDEVGKARFNITKGSDTSFISKAGSPYWSASIEDATEAVSMVVIHGGDEYPLLEVQVAMMDHKGKVVWTSACHSVAHGHPNYVVVCVPNLSGARIKAFKESPPLCLRKVEAFALQTSKYRLSTTVLTIDKHEVAQPFTLAELNTNQSTYKNLCTVSAQHAVENAASMVEDDAGATNLAHYLQMCWSAETGEVVHQQKDAFFNTFIKVLERVKTLLQSQPALIDIRSPCYVFGDIHGNFEDMLFFLKNLTPFRHIKYSGHNFLFLGDYVDRGPHDVECLAYLLSLKVQAPEKFFLLRGNHEDAKQNSAESLGDSSFLAHCRATFGTDKGTILWRKANEVFQYMPLCAVVGGRVFCCHGGIPQPILSNGNPLTIRQIMENVKRPLVNVGSFVENEYESAASDLLWADPDKEGKYETFGPNKSRGCSHVFGSKAVEEFMELNQFCYLIRAHQWFSFGVNISKKGRVITLFTSSDYCYQTSCAACALVGADGRIQLMMKEHRSKES